MKVLISGNIASGKGTLIRGLVEELPDYEHLAIDDYRAKYGDGTEDGELRAREQFIFDIRWSENCFIECTGVGKLYSLIKPEIEANFLLYTNQKLCLKRFEERNTKAIIPLNWFRGKKLSQSLYYINTCHDKTKYKLTVRDNKKKDVLRIVSKVKSLQRGVRRLR
jgi:hypothetical protein